MILSVLLYSFVVFTVIQIAYYICFSTFLFHRKKENKETIKVPVSVVICAKNEIENLQKILPSLINQEYDDFEILLINDASSEETSEMMQLLEKKYEKLKIINVENIEAFWGNKKYALTLGIKAAKYNHLLFIDADCKPVSKHWIAEMSQNFSKEKTIVIGYGKYIKVNSLVNLFVRFENLLTAIQYFSYAKMGSPFMATSRNLSYHRNEFFKVSGFINHMHIKSGADEFFIQDAANKQNTEIATTENSFTISETPPSFKELFHKKRLQLTRRKHYKLKHKFFLRLFLVSKIFFYLLATVLFFFYPWKIKLPIVLTYYLVQFIVIGFSAKKLQEPQVTYFLPFLEIGLLIFQLSIFITNLSSKPTHWK
ncbi:glycosyltransferase [Polaribacter sp.]|uniref:glycosyltransferase n=1 Tax=Polaribacter sp. TaxID=1920175 RepID=UPI003EFA95EC